MAETKTTTRLLLIFVLFFIGKFAYDKYWHPEIYKGEGYSIVIPEGWEKKKVDKETVLFIAPERDYIHEMNVAMISVYSKKFDKYALFLDDLWPQVMETLADQKVKVLEKGEIKIDTVVSKWVLFMKEEPEMLVLTFYTIDDYNRLIRLQYATQPAKFGVYREVFEKTKESLKLQHLFKLPKT